MVVIQPLIVLVDPDHRLRDELAARVERMGFPVRSYSDGAEYLDGVDRERHGCVITHLRSPGTLGGEALIERLKERDIVNPVIVVSDAPEPRSIVRAMKAGAADFLDRELDVELFEDSVREALATDLELRAAVRERTRIRNRVESLTPREFEVFALIVDDHSNKEIADMLGISRRTVEHHREHLMMKMQVDSLVQLVTLAVSHGLPGAARAN